MQAGAWLGVPAQMVRVMLPIAAPVLGVVTLLFVPLPAAPVTTYAAASRSSGAADLAAGVCLVAAGTVVWLLRPRSGSGLYVVSLAAGAWFAARWTGWEGGPPLARSIGMVFEPFFLPFMFHLVITAPTGRAQSSHARLALGAVYAGSAVMGVGRALLRDPFLDPYCWSNCRDNVFLLHAQPDLARALDSGMIVATFTVGLALVAVAWTRMWAATAPARRSLGPILLPGGLLGAASATYAVALARQRLEPADDVVFSSLFQVRAWASAALAAGVAWIVVRGWRARAALARLAADLSVAPLPGSLGSALAQATGDSRLDVVYPLPASGRYATATGTTVDLPLPGTHRTTTPLVRNGQAIALVLHDAAIVDAEQLRMEIGPAARLAIHNERLQAEVLAQLDDLRTSRARIVATGDAERQRLERNLHDGAQQRLLALSYDLRLAKTTAEAAGDSELAALLSLSEEEALQAIMDLRELAQGIYPAVLAESGLAAAIWTLTDSAAFPVEFEGEPFRRLREVVERAALVVVSEALDAAQRDGSAAVTVRLSEHDARLIVEVEGAGPGPFLHVADRVGALGGRLAVEPDLLRAELPCE